jgi:hypothetical protein
LYPPGAQQKVPSVSSVARKTVIPPQVCADQRKIELVVSLGESEDHSDGELTVSAVFRTCYNQTICVTACH